MKVVIVSPEKTLFENEATSVKLPGSQGRFEVLEGHAPIVSTLAKGEVACLGAHPFEVKIIGGFVEVARDVVSVCVEVQD